jgi:hypothetical protein
MDHFLLCKNPSCRFLLDRRLNGRSPDNSELILKKCPACGGAWSSTCPFCGRALSVSFADGFPHSACCEQRLRGEAQAA